MINQFNVNIPQNYDMFQLYNTNIFDSSPIGTNMARTVLKMQLKDIQQRLLNQVLLDVRLTLNYWLINMNVNSQG